MRALYLNQVNPLDSFLGTLGIVNELEFKKIMLTI